MTQTQLFYRQVTCVGTSAEHQVSGLGEGNMFLVVQQDFAILPTFARLFPLVLSQTYFSIHTSFRRILILATNLFTYEQPYLTCALHFLHSVLFFFLECEAVITLKSGPKHPSDKM